MKKLKLTAYAVLCCVLLACSKDEKNIIVKGRILKDCNGTPLANYDLLLGVDYSTWTRPYNLEYFSFTTDKNGYFSFICPREGSGEIQTTTYYKFLTGIPITEDVDLGTFYDIPVTSFVYRIKVNNPYQEGDTLYVPNFLGFGGYKIPAPLYDSIFPPVTNYTPLATQSYPIDGTIPIPNGYTVYRGPATTANNKIAEKDNDLFYPSTCPTQIDTLTIEIN